LLLWSTTCQSVQNRPFPPEPLPGHYETRRNHDPNGIGKFYLGREIARVMGYQGADWLERPERIEEERPGRGRRADGAPPGRCRRRYRRRDGILQFSGLRSVVTMGEVLAVDLQPEMLEIIERRKRELEDRQCPERPKHRTRSVNLPTGSIDVAFFADVYHEF
jgi:hypothetical protein